MEWRDNSVDMKYNCNLWIASDRCEFGLEQGPWCFTEQIKLYLYCLVLVGSRNRFERYITIKLKYGKLT